MKPKKIEISNFLSFSPEKQTYYFPNNGVTLIIGSKDTDNDSNGSGKSSFMEAMLWCLKGETIKGLKSDEIINRKNLSKEAIVSFEFEYGGEKCKIIRSRKPGKSNLSFYKGDRDETRQTIDGTQKAIDEMLDFNFHTMTRAIICSEDQDVKFLRLKNSLRAEVVENLIFGADFKAMNEKAKKLRKKLKEDLEPVELSYQEKESFIKAKIDTLKQYKEHKKEKISELEKEIAELKNIDVERLIQISSFLKEKNSIDKESKELTVTINKLEKELQVLKKIDVKEAKDRIKIEKDIEDIDKNINLLKSTLQDLENKIKSREKKIEEINCSNNNINKELLELNKFSVEKYKEKVIVTKEIEEIKKEKANIDKNYKNISDIILDIQERISVFEDEILKLNKDIEKILANKCYTCGATLDKEVAEKKKEEVDSKIKINKTKIDKLKEEVYAKNIEKDGLEKDLAALKEKYNRIKEKHKELELVPLLEEEKINTISSKKIELASSLEHNKSIIEELYTEIKDELGKPVSDTNLLLCEEKKKKENLVDKLNKNKSGSFKEEELENIKTDIIKKETLLEKHKQNFNEMDKKSEKVCKDFTIKTGIEVSDAFKQSSNIRDIEELNKIYITIKEKEAMLEKYNDTSLEKEQAETLKKDMEGLKVLKTGYLGMKDDLKYYDFIVESLGNGENCFKNYYFETIIAHISKKATDYMKTFFAEDTISINFDRELNETLTRNSDIVSYNSFSLGEKARIDLSMMLTFNFLARIKMKESFNILCLDEILDGNVDETGMNKFIHIIEEMSKDVLIFVISHKDKLVTKFHRLLQIEKVDGNSFIK